MITAIFPTGVNEITVSGLHQWDYGQELEIHASELPAIVEVHFSCPGMSEAVVRTCSTVDGVVSAMIPDICMGQTRPITAWMYEIEGTSGRTTKKITLPVIARTRPAPSAAQEPEGIDDKYTQLVTAIDEQIVASTAEINKTVDVAKTDIQETVSTAKAEIQTDLDKLATGDIVAAQAVLAQNIKSTAYDGTVGSSSIEYKWGDMTMNIGDGAGEDLGIIPAGMLMGPVSEVDLSAGMAYTSSCLASKWTRVQFTIVDVGGSRSYESLKFKINAGIRSISLDPDGTFSVSLGGTDDKYLKFYNTESGTDTLVTIHKIIQYAS